MSADNMKGMFDRIIRNKVRMGNFETTDQDILSIQSLLQFPAGPFSVADFCAGSGRALELLMEESDGVGFGIEPNEQKYLELRSRLPYALFGGMISAGSAGYVSINVPQPAIRCATFWQTVSPSQATAKTNAA